MFTTAKSGLSFLSLDTDGDKSDDEWVAGVSNEWAEDWLDRREDIYTLDDGKPVDAAR